MSHGHSVCGWLSLAVQMCFIMENPEVIKCPLGKTLKPKLLVVKLVPCVWQMLSSVCEWVNEK